MSDFKYPTSTFLKRESKKKESKAEQAIKDFGSLMSDKTHPDNQTEAYHNNVKSILNSLLVGADELENKKNDESKNLQDFFDKRGFWCIILLLT